MGQHVSKEQMGVLPYIVAIDFDGTLVADKFPEIGEKNVKVFNDALEAQRMGAKLILWTSRNGEALNNAVDFCQGEGLLFDAVNANLLEVKTLFGGDTRKVYANEYWDDKAIERYCTVSSVLNRG